MWHCLVPKPSCHPVPPIAFYSLWQKKASGEWHHGHCTCSIAQLLWGHTWMVLLVLPVHSPPCCPDCSSKFILLNISSILPSTAEKWLPISFSTSALCFIQSQDTGPDNKCLEPFPDYLLETVYCGNKFCQSVNWAPFLYLFFSEWRCLLLFFAFLEAKLVSSLIFSVAYPHNKP